MANDKGKNFVVAVRRFLNMFSFLPTGHFQRSFRSKILFALLGYFF